MLRGFEKDDDSILKIIRYHCEPLIEPEISRVRIDDIPILIIEIAPGKDKPYLLKSRGVAYIRHGSNDYPATRLEFDRIYQSKQQAIGLTRQY